MSRLLSTVRSLLPTGSMSVTIFEDNMMVSVEIINVHSLSSCTLSSSADKNLSIYSKRHALGCLLYIITCNRENKKELKRIYMWTSWKVINIFKPWIPYSSLKTNYKYAFIFWYRHASNKFYWVSTHSSSGHYVYSMNIQNISEHIKV